MLPPPGSAADDFSTDAAVEEHGLSPAQAVLYEFVGGRHDCKETFYSLFVNLGFAG
jgi:hypothetical protein